MAQHTRQKAEPHQSELSHLALNSSASSLPSLTSCASCWCFATWACSSLPHRQRPSSRLCARRCRSSPHKLHAASQVPAGPAACTGRSAATAAAAEQTLALPRCPTCSATRLPAPTPAQQQIMGRGGHYGGRMQCQHSAECTAPPAGRRRLPAATTTRRTLDLAAALRLHAAGGQPAKRLHCPAKWLLALAAAFVRHRATAASGGRRWRQAAAVRSGRWSRCAAWQHVTTASAAFCPGCSRSEARESAAECGLASTAPSANLHDFKYVVQSNTKRFVQMRRPGKLLSAAATWHWAFAVTEVLGRPHDRWLHIAGVRCWQCWRCQWPAGSCPRLLLLHSLPGTFSGRALQ